MSKKSSKSKINSLTPLPTIIPSLIRKIDKQFDHQERKLFRMHGIQGLTPPQLFILRQLWKQDGLQLKALAEAAHSTRATITGIIDTMEEDGYVTREPNPEDGRSLLVKLTEKGNELQKYKPPFDSDICSCFKDFTLEELEVLSQLLKKLSDSIKN